MPNIKLAIVDDQVLFLKGLRLLMSSFSDIELIIEAQNGQEIIDAIPHNPPDVILMDLKMPVMDGIEATQKIKASYPDIKIILLTMYNDESLINHMMKAGANGYLLKNEEPEILKDAIHAVVEKDYYFNDYVSKALLRGMQSKDEEVRPWKSSNNVHLTKRELEVLHLICKEYTSAQIAEQLFISIRTVENHRKSLLEKTGAKNTVGLVMYAIQNKLIELN